MLLNSLLQITRFLRNTIMMWILGIVGFCLAIFIVCVVIRIVKKVTTPTTLDVIVDNHHS